MARLFKTGITAEGDVSLAAKIKFSNTGTGAPSFTTYSNGVRNVLYDNVGATSVGYTTGIDAGVLWNSIPAADAGMSFKWYGGTTVLATLTGAGALSTTGDISTSGFLKSTNSSGDEGGQIDLAKSVTNTTLTTGVTIDVFQNKLRLFETGGTNRGYYIDISGGATSAGTNLIGGGSYTLPAATSTVLGGIELFSDTAQTTASNSVTTTASRTYGLQVNASGQGVINVPWTDTVYTLPVATTTVLGGIELFDGTVQSTAANAVTTTASRTYGLQVNAAGQGVINVPWVDTDTNTFPTTWTWTGGTTAGPTASITGTSSTITVAGVPVASGSASGVVTTGTQTFAGTKTLSGSLILAAGTNIPLIPLTFTQNTTTPTAVSGGMDYDGIVFYQAADTNPGRALATQNYYYASSANYIVDFSGSAAAQSVLGASTRGITVAAGTTYEYELSMAVQHQFQIETGITGTFSLVNTAGATMTHISYVDYGSNTTAFTTATTMSSVRTTGNVTFSSTISAGSRYSIVKAKGLIRVTVSGTTKIYPALSTSAVNQNTWTVQSGLIFKLTPIGNGTVTSVGAWA